MGYSVVGDLAHATEDALDKLGRGRWQLTPLLTQLLFDALDRLQELLADVAAGRDPTADTSMLERLRAPESLSARRCFRNGHPSKLALPIGPASRASGSERCAASP